MTAYHQPVYRPPSEAHSLILQATLGCSHNRCRFCYMYKSKEFSAKPADIFDEEIRSAARMFPETRRIFLADGDAFVLSSSRLERILDTLSESFPLLQRVSAYANPSNLLAKSVDEMRRLKEKKLAVLYYGIESGDPAVLEKVDKGATPEQMAEGCLKAAESGIKLSVTVILGLAGRKGSLAHARATASLVNTIRPRFLSALTLMLGPYEKEFSRSMGPGFEYNSPVDDVRELRELVAGITADKCIFRSNHASNYLALKGTLQKDREALLKLIDSALKDPDGYFRDEWMRGL